MSASPGLILTTTFMLALLMFTLLWRIHVAARDASVIDYYWGPGFLAIALATVVLSAPPTLPQVLFLLALALWTARLTHYVVRRHLRAGEEDGRYRRFREKGGEAFWWKSLITIFLLQAVLQWMIASPVIAALGFARADPSIGLAACGCLLFAVGFAVEAVADAQLARHRNDPQTAGEVLTTGLWAWSRHPNYLGEIVLWWGLGLMAYALSGSLWSFFGPAVLTLVIRGVSIRLTEEHVAAVRPGFEAYRARTAMLVPRPPKPIMSAESRSGSKASG